MNSLHKRSIPLAAVLLVLAGCGDAQPAPEATETATAAAGATGEMSMAPEAAKTVAAKSSGTVTAVDAQAGKVTLDHAAIPEAEWPAMAMAFDVDPAILGDIKVGDRVAFDVEIAGSNGRVTAIAKQ